MTYQCDILSLQSLWVSSSVTNLGRLHCWYSVFLIQCTDVRWGSHIWEPIFFKSQFLINNCYPIVPNVLEYMNVIIYTINISSKTFEEPIAWTHELVISSLVGGAIITNQRNWETTSINYCLRCISMICSRSPVFTFATEITWRIYWGPPWWQTILITRAWAASLPILKHHSCCMHMSKNMNTSERLCLSKFDFVKKDVD